MRDPKAELAKRYLEKRDSLDKRLLKDALSVGIAEGEDVYALPDGREVVGFYGFMAAVRAYAALC